MELRNTVLDSELEANTFQTLESKWSPTFKIFPSLPLLEIFQVDSSELNAKELWYFNKGQAIRYLPPMSVRLGVEVSF